MLMLTGLLSFYSFSSIYLFIQRLSTPTWKITSVRCKNDLSVCLVFRVPELCESRGGRPGLSVLMSLTVSVDVKQQRTYHA